MKIWSVKSPSLVESSVINLINLHFINNTYGIPWGTGPVTPYFVVLATCVKYPNLDLKINIWKRKKCRDNLEIESRYLKLCLKFSTFIRCMKAAFYRLDDQNFLMCPLIKRLGQAFVLKNVAESLFKKKLKVPSGVWKAWLSV